MIQMKCPECDKKMEKVMVAIEGSSKKAVSYQCECGHFDFEQKSAKEVIKELKKKETPLRIEQNLIKLSQDRLGLYFNRDIIRSLNLKAGEKVYLSIPDKNHIILEMRN